MAEIKLSKEMLQGEGSKVLFRGTTTDKILNFYGWGDSDKQLKFVVKKGYVDDWCVYVESMIDEQDYEAVESVGNKLSPETARLLVDCDDEVIGRYRI